MANLDEFSLVHKAREVSLAIVTNKLVTSMQMKSVKFENEVRAVNRVTEAISKKLPLISTFSLENKKVLVPAMIGNWKEIRIQMCPTLILRWI